MKTYVGIARDHSGSMYLLNIEAMNDFNGLIKSFKHASDTEEIDTIVNVVTFGKDSQVQREIVNSSLNAVTNLNSYKTYLQTPLWDAVGELIEIMSNVPDADSDVRFLVSVITDGEENKSTKWTASKLAARIKVLQATDKWTFTFRVPKGYSSELVKLLGVPSGNVIEWEQSKKGIEESTSKTQDAVVNMYRQYKTGVRSSSSFYTNLSNTSMKSVKQNLSDISSHVNIWPVKIGGIQIRDFVEGKGREYQLGVAFYQLTKREEVQGNKLFCVRHKHSGKVYSGDEARDMMGLPSGGSIKIAPGDHGDYDIFVQSTSVNRKLVANTELLYWPGAKKI